MDVSLSPAWSSKNKEQTNKQSNINKSHTMININLSEKLPKDAKTILQGCINVSEGAEI